MKLVIFGCGYSGMAIAKAFAAAGAHVCGTTRSAEKLGHRTAAGIEGFIFDGETLSPELAAAMRGTTHLVQSIAPRESGDPLINIAGSELATLMPELQWHLGYPYAVGLMIVSALMPFLYFKRRGWV